MAIRAAVALRANAAISTHCWPNMCRRDVATAGGAGDLSGVAGLSQLGRNDPAGVFEQRGRVAFGPGPLFGTGGDGFVGLNFATSPAILKEAVQRMRAAIPRLTSHRPSHGLMAAVAGRHGTTRSPNSAVHE